MIPNNSARGAINCFIGVCIAMALTDGMPRMNRYHARLQDVIDPILDLTGTWQGDWDLFAPSPDNTNCRVSAVVTFDDGVKAHWRSPDWQDYNPLQKFVDFREMEFIDSIHNERFSNAWAGFAAYLSRRIRHPGGGDATPVEVQLIEHSAKIPPPSERILPAEPYLNFNKRSTFYTWKPRDDRT